jgi:hypothetical protein
VAVSGGPSTYTVAVSGMTAGTVIATIGAGVVTDATGNPNRASTSTDNTVTFNTAAPSTTETRVEDTDLSITYAPGCEAPPNPCPLDWFHGSRSRAWSAATSSFNRATGALATFRFTGTSVTWIGFRAWWAGIARVSVDGGTPTVVDLYVGAGLDPLSPPCDPDFQGPQQPPPGCVDEDVQAPVFTAMGLTAGVEHTLAIEVTGQRNALAPADCGPANCNAVVVDAFDVGPSVPPAAEGQRFEQTSPATTYGAGWTQGDTTRAWSGLTAATSTTVGAQATFTFTGTSVSWIGLRGLQTGIASVFLDGAFQTQVDTYSPTEIQARVLELTDLAPAGHNLMIKVAGKNPEATSNLIVVDAFDVGSRFEDKDSSVVYTGAAGAWRLGDDQKAWSGTGGNSGPGTAAYSRTKDAAVEFTFKGTSVTWISRRAASDGLADVSLDGGPATRVDLYSPTEKLRVPVFTAGPLTLGTHTLRISVTGLQSPQNPGPGDALVVVDAFDVTLPSPGVPVRRFQETDPLPQETGPSVAPTYTPLAASRDADPRGSTGWVQGTGFPFWSGQTAMFSEMAGAQATFTFAGTSVTWIGDRSGNAGIAEVTLDGGTPVLVDAFTTAVGDNQTALFSRREMTPGTHTLTIKVTGRKNAQSGAATIVIDAIDIQN